MDMDRKILVLPSGALRLLRARAATLAASDVGMSSVPDIQTNKVELLPCGTAIAVAFGKIGETVGTIQRIVLPQGAVPGPHVRRDATLHEPMQELAVAVSGIGGHGRGFPSLPLSEASNHVSCCHCLLAHAGRG